MLNPCLSSENIHLVTKMPVKHFYLQCRCVSRAVQNQTIKCEMNFLITALQGHENPYKMRVENTLYIVYGTSCISFKMLIFFSHGLKSSTKSALFVRYEAEMSLSSNETLEREITIKQTYLSKSIACLHGCVCIAAQVSSKVQET